MAYAELLRFNPWWEDRAAIGQDKDLAKFSAEPVKYLPGFKPSPGLNVVRGPRQVGKTTLAKLRIRELLEGGTEPKRIFFYSFELMRTPEDVYNTLIEYLETAGRGPGARHMFLDETTTIPEWSRGLKLLIDRGDIRGEDTILVTGSSSIDLKKGAERFPGRGIEGKEFFYLPCTFRRCLQLKGIVVPPSDPLNPARFFKDAEENMPKILKLNSEFRDYLSRGGFLYAINHGKDELSLERYARWLEGDFVKWGKNPLVVKEILQALIRKGCSQFSYHAIAKETSVSSHNTLIDYLSMVNEELFARTVSKASLPFKAERRKEKKAFFLDPLLSAVAERWAEQTLPEGCRVEHAVMSNLSRLGPLFFYNDGRAEIDCLLRLRGKSLGVEVKWSDNISPADAFGVKKAGIAYLLSRETLGKVSGVPVVPASLFLAMLDAGELIRRDVLSLQ